MMPTCTLLFEGIDQIDLPGPFELLSRIPNATYRIYVKATATPVRDVEDCGLGPTQSSPMRRRWMSCTCHGQEALMEDVEVLGWIRQQAAGACSIFSVCTGALYCGTAGLLKGRRATTHWSAFHLLRWRDPRQRACGRRWSVLPLVSQAALQQLQSAFGMIPNLCRRLRS